MIEERICYYTRKVMQYGQVHVNKKRNRYRYDRLMQYKKLMYKLIGADS